MNIQDFQNQFKSYQIFSLRDIQKRCPEFQKKQLGRWEKKGYIQKIKQGFYAFANQKRSESFLLLVSNRIYSPSYVSLEKALKYYNLIPEEIFQITSVSPKRTTSFETPVGNFKYRTIKPGLFWGYRLISYNERKIMMAEPEKAILDYLYLNAHLKTAADFSEMRINPDSFQENIDLRKFLGYLEAFGNKSLTKRTQAFLNTIKNDQSDTNSRRIPAAFASFPGKRP